MSDDTEYEHDIELCGSPECHGCWVRAVLDQPTTQDPT